MAMVKVSVMCLLDFSFLVGNVVGGRHPSALGVVSVGSEEPLQVRSRSDFPEGFVFGTSSAAYQYEGAVKEGGRGPCIWDSACHMPGIIHDNNTGDVANDHYHRYQWQTVGGHRTAGGSRGGQLSLFNCLAAYFPDGRGPVAKPVGIAFYNSLIASLLSRGIEPFVCLSHYDLPQTLQDEFGGWRSPQIVPLFRSFAETCFAAFGDRVKYWITFNEIHNFAIKYTNFGYMGPSGLCGNGNSSTWVYATEIVKCGISAVELYRTKFQAQQGGKIGIIADAQWYEPYSDSPADIEAVERMQAFQLQWFEGGRSNLDRGWFRMAEYRTVWYTQKEYVMASGRFVIYYVDYVHNATRHAKDSAKWFKEFLRPLPQPKHPKHAES